MGISRDMIRSAIDEAISNGFIECVDKPRQKSKGSLHRTGRYILKWDESGRYVKDPDHFRGFFAGEGNRTYIPNAFFDTLIPSEPLAVIKVVGAIIRFSIGFQTKWGHRRTNVSLSYQHIQNYSKIADRKTLAATIRRAMDGNYIERVEEGFFDPDAGRRSKAAVYALKWLSAAAKLAVGQKTPPAKIDAENRSEIPTGIGQKPNRPIGQKNPTDIEIKQSNKTNKQKLVEMVGEAAVAFERLRKEGFDVKSSENARVRSLTRNHRKADRLARAPTDQEKSARNASGGDRTRRAAHSKVGSTQPASLRDDLLTSNRRSKAPPR